MRTLKIAVGTNSKDKIRFLSEVIENVGLKAKIIPCQVQSRVSDQPITEMETKKDL
ncbi:MAG: DUF84 family protein [Patescibacteria group bacterium]|nr:DUF84 family protein [Patescibacteria group bacterium]